MVNDKLKFNPKIHYRVLSFLGKRKPPPTGTALLLVSRVEIFSNKITIETEKLY
jgi:hypothetical protein